MLQIGKNVPFVCPIYSCFLEFLSADELKKHTEEIHPELKVNNLNVDNNGNLTIDV